MFTILISIAIYTVVVLLFVPLDKIGKYQLEVKKHYKKLVDKMNSK